MKLLIILVLVIAWSLMANEITAQETGETAETEPVEERTCIPAEEVEQSAGEESGPSEEGSVDNEEAVLPICDEETPEDALPEDLSEEQASTSEEGDASEEETIDDEFDPSQEFEVNPEDEISEDYPVPLPSDI